MKIDINGLRDERKTTCKMMKNRSKAEKLSARNVIDFDAQISDILSSDFQFV